MRVIFLGPPGSGKGTQSHLLAQKNGLVYMGTGDMLREAMAQHTPLGERARPFVESGRLVPDDLVNELIAERLNRADQPTHFVIDGYPRTVPQAQALDRLLESRKLGLTAVLVMVVPDEEIIRRLRGRQRDDDGEETVRSRLVVFHQQTAAIAAHYRAKGIRHEVSGIGSIDDVYKSIVKILQTASGCQSC
jgi:adenylate kinase